MTWSRGWFPRLGLAAILALTGCADRLPEPIPLPPVSPPVAPDPTVAGYYAQVATWADCPLAHRECTTLTVPRDYAHPDAGSLELALARVPARNARTRLGSLVINPGGPGLSAVGALDGAAKVVGGEVRDVFDLVGVDPRGVGGSTPVSCVTDAQLDAWRSPGYDVAAQGGPARRAADASSIADGCAHDAGDLLAHVDTASAARDLDIVRAVLGDDRLTYLGVSYGTELGARYADLFPARVGRMVLDAGLDPTMDDTQRTLGLAAGFEYALGRYVAYCLNSASCPLPAPSAAALDRFRDLLTDLATQPLATGSGRDLTAPLAVGALMQGVADDQTWPDLSTALTAALDRADGAPLMAMADAGAGRSTDGHYPGNAFEASTAITCLDSPARLTTRAAHRVLPAAGRGVPDLRAVPDRHRGPLRRVAGAAQRDSRTHDSLWGGPGPGRRDHPRPRGALPVVDRPGRAARVRRTPDLRRVRAHRLWALEPLRLRCRRRLPADRSGPQHAQLLTADGTPWGVGCPAR